MSLFGALYTAVSGLSGQSAAFANISDNLANSQTIGFKSTDTSFIDLLTASTATQNESGSVTTRPDYENNVQGTVTASNDATALAVSGNGFFAVQHAAQTSGTTPSLSSQQYYTRAGDFSLTQDGYLQNSEGDYLDGWSVNPSTGVTDQTTLAPIKISNAQYNPVATSTVNLSANLPATPATGSTTGSSINVYDALGTQHTLDIAWAQNAGGVWTATISSPDNTPSATIGSAQVSFGAASGNSVPAGTINAIGSASGGVTGTSYSPGGNATLTAAANFGSGTQPITIDLGAFGASTGITQFAGTSYQLNTVSQNGAPAGSYSGVSITQSGDVVVNYNNGQTQTVAQVPLAVFSNANALQRQNGQAFTATQQSGAGIIQGANSGAAGSLAVGSVEQSNVDIATEFSKLIIAQQAYGANTKVVSTANQMLSEALDMKQIEQG